jgi:hypothetical protein
MKMIDSSIIPFTRETMEQFTAMETSLSDASPYDANEEDYK